MYETLCSLLFLMEVTNQSSKLEFRTAQEEGGCTSEVGPERTAGGEASERKHHSIRNVHAKATFFLATRGRRHKESEGRGITPLQI